MHRFILYLITCASALKVKIITSSLKPIQPEILSNALQSFFPTTSHIQITFELDKNIDDAWDNILQHDIILNLSESLIARIALERLSKENSKAYFSSSIWADSQFSFKLAHDPINVAQALEEFLKWLDWDRIGYLYEIGTGQPDISEVIKENFNVNQLSIGDDIPQSTINILVGRELKANGYKLFLINTQVPRLQDILNSMEHMKMQRKGYGFLTWQTYFYTKQNNGVLTISPPQAFIADSYEQSIANAFYTYIQNYDSFQLSNMSDAELLQIFNQNETFTTKPRFEIYNIQNNIPVKLGKIEELKITVDIAITFPGQTQEFPNKGQKVIIPISSSLNGWDPIWFPNTDEPNSRRLGEIVQVELINSSDQILPYFDLQLNDIKCGQYNYIPGDTEKCIMENLDRIGLYYVGAMYTTLAIQTQIILKDLGYEVPSISSLSSGSLLGDISMFPKMVMIPPLSSQYYMGITRAAYQLGVRNINYICDTTHESSMPEVTGIVKAAPINILNEKGVMMVPDYTEDDKSPLENAVKAVLETDARFIFTRSESGFGVDLMNELIRQGARGKDINFIHALTDWWAIFDYEDELSAERQELLTGSINILMQFGDPQILINVQKQIKEKFNQDADTTACFSVDTIAVIAHTFDLIITRGEDYEDFEKVNHITRILKFSGCTGLIVFGEGVNNRIFEKWRIFSYRYPEGKYESFDFVFYQPYGINVIEFIEPIVYPDGTTEWPSDFRRIDYSCAANENEFSLNTDSIYLAIGLNCGITVLALIFALVILKRYKKRLIQEDEPPSNKELLALGDIAIFLTLFLEVIQFIAIAPKRGLGERRLDSLIHFSLFDLASYVDLSGGQFQEQYNSFLSILIIILLIMILALCKVHEIEDQKWLLFIRLAGYATRSIPLLIQGLLFPLAYYMNSVYMCFEGEEEGITEAVFDLDCEYYCWQGKHLTYVILFAICLFTLQILIMTTGSYFQSYVIPLNVSARWYFLVSKTGLKFIIAALARPLAQISENAYSIVYLVLIGSYTAFLVKFPPFNYQRTNLWQVVAFVAIFYTEIIRFVLQSVEPLLTFVIVSSGIVGICVLGMGVQVRYRIQSWLYRDQGTPIEILFKFQLSRATASQLGIISPELNYLSRHVYSPDVLNANLQDGASESERKIIIKQQIFRF